MIKPCVSLALLLIFVIAQVFSAFAAGSQGANQIFP